MTKLIVRNKQNNETRARKHYVTTNVSLSLSLLQPLTYKVHSAAARF